MPTGDEIGGAVAGGASALPPLFGRGQSHRSVAGFTDPNSHSGYDPNASEYGGYQGGLQQRRDWLGGRGEMARNRSAFNAGYGEAGRYGAYGDAARGGQNEAAGLMLARARGDVPSIAGMQAQNDMARIAREQSSAAASARGAGAMANAQKWGAANTAAAQGQVDANAQVNAAQERLAAEQGAAGAFGALRQGDQGAQDAAANREQFNVGMNQRNRESNDSTALGYEQLENQAIGQAGAMKTQGQATLAGSYGQTEGQNQGTSNENAKSKGLLESIPDFFSSDSRAKYITSDFTSKLPLLGGGGGPSMMSPASAAGPATFDKLSPGGGMDVGGSLKAHSDFGTQFVGDPSGGAMGGFGGFLSDERAKEAARREGFRDGWNTSGPYHQNIMAGGDPGATPEIPEYMQKAMTGGDKPSAMAEAGPTKPATARRDLGIHMATVAGGPVGGALAAGAYGAGRRAQASPPIDVGPVTIAEAEQMAVNNRRAGGDKLQGGTEAGKAGQVIRGQATGGARKAGAKHDHEEPSFYRGDEPSPVEDNYDPRYYVGPKPKPDAGDLITSDFTAKGLLSGRAGDDMVLSLANKKAAPAKAAPAAAAPRRPSAAEAQRASDEVDARMRNMGVEPRETSGQVKLDRIGTTRAGADRKMAPREGAFSGHGGDPTASRMEYRPGYGWYDPSRGGEQSTEGLDDYLKKQTDEDRVYAQQDREVEALQAQDAAAAKRRDEATEGSMAPGSADWSQYGEKGQPGPRGASKYRVQAVKGDDGNMTTKTSWEMGEEAPGPEEAQALADNAEQGKPMPWWMAVSKAGKNLSDAQFGSSVRSDERAKHVGASRGSASSGGGGMPGPSDSEVADANRTMFGQPYVYKPEFTPKDQVPGEPNYGFMAQNLEKNPISATAVKEDPNGMKRVDAHKLLKVVASGLADLQKQEDETRLALRKGRSKAA